MKHFGQLLSKQLRRFVDIAWQRRKPSTGSQMWVECKANSKEKSGQNLTGQQLPFGKAEVPAMTQMASNEIDLIG